MNHTSILLLIASLCWVTAYSKNNTYKILCGSYVSYPDTALKLLEFNEADTSLRVISGYPDVKRASYFIQSPYGTVYVATEGDKNTSCITSLTPSIEYPYFKVLNQVAVGAAAPCYINISPDGKFVLTANYNDASITIFPLSERGEVGPIRQKLQFDGNGPIKGRQDSSHPHCVTFTPDERFLLINDLGLDCIHTYPLCPPGSNELVFPLSGRKVSLPAEYGPRHTFFNKAGDKAYLINEISDSVTVLSYRDGRLVPVQHISADTVQAHGAGDIHLSPDEKFLYASLRLKNDGLATFQKDSLTGRLTYIAHTPTGLHPRNFMITPDGEFLLVASKNDNRIEVYSIDPVTGIPEYTGKHFNQASPVCLKVVKTKE